jgi:hypothetical protein
LQWTVALGPPVPRGESCEMPRVRPHRLGPVSSGAFAGFRFPPDVIVLAMRWYLRFGLSYRDVEELLSERRIEVDHVTVYVYRAIDQFGQVLYVYVSPRRDIQAARRFFVTCPSTPAASPGRHDHSRRASQRTLPNQTRRAGIHPFPGGVFWTVFTDPEHPPQIFSPAPVRRDPALRVRQTTAPSRSTASLTTLRAMSDAART